MEEILRKDKRFTRFCPSGHDKLLTGKNKRGVCLKCDSIRNNKTYYLNRDVILVKQQHYYATHKKQRNARNKKKLKSDVVYKLRCTLRSRFISAFRHNYKSGSAIRDLGCTIVELKRYLEVKFQSGMTWDNWGRGKGKWNIDHILPLSRVDLSDRKQFLKVVHYTNLQPLWFIDNLKKSNFLY